jgi:hypothetical protein
MTKTDRGNDRLHKLKIKPHADRLRAILAALPCPGIVEVKFAPGDWTPTARFWSYTGEKMGRSFSVRRIHDKTFIFRLV